MSRYVWYGMVGCRSLPTHVHTGQAKIHRGPTSQGLIYLRTTTAKQGSVLLTFQAFVAFSFPVFPVVLHSPEYLKSSSPADTIRLLHPPPSPLLDKQVCDTNLTAGSVMFLLVVCEEIEDSILLQPPQKQHCVINDGGSIISFRHQTHQHSLSLYIPSIQLTRLWKKSLRWLTVAGIPQLPEYRS